MTKAYSGIDGNYHVACAQILDALDEKDLIDVDNDEICAGCGLSLAVAANSEETDEVDDKVDEPEDDDDDDDDEAVDRDPEPEEAP